jgi:hypothetical protein
VRWCYGKTPMQTFIDTPPVAKEKLMQAAQCRQIRSTGQPSSD